MTERIPTVEDLFRPDFARKTPFAVNHHYPGLRKLFRKDAGGDLGAVDRAVSATRTPESKLEGIEPTFDIPSCRRRGERKGRSQKVECLRTFLKKLDYVIVKPRPGPVSFKPSGIWNGPAVEHESAAVAREIVGVSFLI